MQIDCCSIATWLHQKWVSSTAEVAVESFRFKSNILCETQKFADFFFIHHCCVELTFDKSLFRQIKRVSGLGKDWLKWLEIPSTFQRGIPSRLIVFPLHTSRCFSRNKSIAILSPMQIRFLFRWSWAVAGGLRNCGAARFKINETVYMWIVIDDCLTLLNGLFIKWNRNWSRLAGFLEPNPYLLLVFVDISSEQLNFFSLFELNNLHFPKISAASWHSKGAVETSKSKNVLAVSFFANGDCRFSARWHFFHSARSCRHYFLVIDKFDEKRWDKQKRRREEERSLTRKPLGRPMPSGSSSLETER